VAHGWSTAASTPSVSENAPVAVFRVPLEACHADPFASCQALLNQAIEVRNDLDAIVKPRLEGRSDLLAAWKSVKRPIEPGGSTSVGSGEDVSPTIVKVA